MAKQLKVINKASGKTYPMDADEAKILKANPVVGKNFAFEAEESTPEPLKTKSTQTPTETK